MMTDATDIETLFTLTAHPQMDAPVASTTYHPSSLQFLEQIHRKKSDLLKQVINTQGWPHPTSHNGHAEATAFLIVQHADYDPDFQRQCHAIMVALAPSGKASLGFLAFLTDRILCNEGRHQRFGTQVREVENGCFVPKAIEQPERVDELRMQAGIAETLSDYLNRVNSGDMLLCRPLLNGFAEELEQQKENKVLEFPGNPH
ncbi:MAG: DUF6624 domain-containing protein [Alphaproteobacteria bacterium]